MTPEQADLLWWHEMRQQNWHDSSGKPETQHNMRMRCWEAVIGAIRKNSEQEMERLRQRVRDLESVVLTRVERDASHIMKSN